MFLVLKWPKKLLQERYPNIEHVDSLSFVIGILAVFLELEINHSIVDFEPGKNKNQPIVVAGLFVV